MKHESGCDELRKATIPSLRQAKAGNAPKALPFYFLFQYTETDLQSVGIFLKAETEQTYPNSQKQKIIIVKDSRAISIRMEFQNRILFNRY